MKSVQGAGEVEAASRKGERWRKDTGFGVGGVRVESDNVGAGFEIQAYAFEFRVTGVKFRVSGSRFRVPDFGFPVSDFGIRWVFRGGGGTS